MEENDEKIRIERILGISVTTNAHFNCDSGLIAYPAGNTVVLLDAGSGTVVSHIVLETKKSVSALQLKNNSLLFVASEDSNFLRVFNWQSGLVKDISPCQNVICAAVSTLLGVLVTVGSDRVVSVWDYKSLVSTSGAHSRNSNGSNASTPTGINNSSRGRKLASSSVACKVSCVYFSPDGNYFVTGGTRHLKFWYLQCGKNECVLTGRPAILGSEHSNADFRDVLTDGVATYAIANFDGTVSSTLCQFDERRFLDKWVQLKTKQALCMTMDDDLLFIGCAEGLIRCFRAGRLDFVATLPLPHHLGVDIAKATDVTALSSHPPVSKFPNVVAIGAPGGKKVVAVYADHSMYAWDVQDIKRVGLSHSWLWHSGCIWDIAMGKPAGRSNSLAGGLPSAVPASLSSGSGGNSSFYQWPSFVTCSNDDTVRTWDITSQTKANLYSNECLDIKYISTRYLDSPLFISHGNGVRCVGIGFNFVCCGDRQGNLRLCRNKTKNELIKIKAHKEEVLSMDVKGTLVATASRDGSVNLYNVNEEIEKVASLQEHTGSVTSVKFLFSERTSPPSLQVISCGADKNLVFRQIVFKKNFINNADDLTERTFLKAAMHMDFSSNVEVQVNSVVTSKTPLFDLETDSSGKHVLVACQDASVRVYNVSSGKHSKTLRSVSNNSNANIGTIIKVTLDPSGYFVAVASTDKTITIFDYYKGDVVASLLGHSELATALRFTPDCQNLMSVGGDSCIFVWALPREMVVTMEARMSEKKSRIATTTKPISTSSSPALQQAPVSAPTTNPSSPVRADYRFSFGQLPDWAKKQIKGEAPNVPDKSKKPAPLPLPKGKWSERVEQASGAMTIKSFYNSDTVVPVPFAKPQNNPKEASLSVVETRVEAFSSVESSAFSSKESSVIPGTEDGNGNSRENSFETCDESLKEILRDVEGDDEESTDFYSDVNKSTDGEASEVPRIQLTRPARSDTDTDESSSTRTSKSSKPIAAFRESPNAPHPFDVVRSRNAELILSVKAKNREISKSRLELEKRLEETRKKLQSIGYKSMSQSTHDLSRGYGKEYLDDSDDENVDNENSGRDGIRRACSLSDLNFLPNSSSTSNANGSNGPSGRRKRSFHRHRNEKSRNGTTGVFDPQNILTRSTSVTTLLHHAPSDSEPESLPITPSYMSKTISSQGKSRRKTPNVVSAYSQENLRDPDDGRLRVSASEQNLSKIGSAKINTPIPRSKMNTPSLKKPQQVAGIAKGMAVVTGVRQGDGDEAPLNLNVASSSVEALRKSLDHVIHLRNRVSMENIAEDAPISRILDEGLRAVQRTLQDSVLFQESRPKIITEHDPTYV
ncbi:unnamed protein product [Allacma fusca]|uniref:Mitogen-activated protein kinase-binding protein 1 n=1 Tax=Allacma fusca TaxID=39272 RepID=A0A8J2L058_9HEXA|nr:unnamed protein product [Allacma fusca]